ncbi:MAG: tetratricopeptide repeat protein [Gemmatimonadales bacterium]
MNLEKLKDSARKFEQKEDWRKAIEVYLKAIQQTESGVETSPDLSLYNRVGDLYLKINDTPSAVRSYERAVDLYADQGFFNNAIALCGKILRVNPGRTQTYLKLAQLHARKNVVIEAKRNLIEFLERMNALSQLDQAFQSVKEFADQFSGSQEIRIMLVELLRAASREDEAREQLEKLAGDIETRGDPAETRRALDRLQVGQDEPRRPSRPLVRPGDLVFLDTGIDIPVAPVPASGQPLPAEPVEVAPPEGLMVSELLVDEAPEALVEGLERTEELDLTVSVTDSFEAEADLDLERTDVAELDFNGEQLEGIEEPVALVDSELDAELLDTAEDLELSLSAAEAGLDPSSEAAAALDLDFVEPDGGDGATQVAATPLPLIPVEDAEMAAALEELEGRVLDDPDNPDIHRQLADRLLATGQLERATEELDLALGGYERMEDWARAFSVTGSLLAVSPDNIRHHQKRVELAYRMGDRAPLLEAYLALGDSLARSGATDKAIAVYGRVQEHDPGNSRAAEAIEALEGRQPPPAPRAAAPAAPATVSAPPAGPPAPAASFVDLGSMVFDESSVRDTRMRIDRREPQDQDEQREFHEILEQFKRGIEENLETDDYQAHYDLGIAFKEMGLLDEAIAEFQKALRAPEGRLRTAEALGICFFEKGQFAISETVLRRAAETADGGDEAKIGVLYWLGRASEAQGKASDAIGSYERALAVDIRFMDVGERVHRLTPGRRE